MLTTKITADEAQRELFARLSDADFPCVGAKSAMARGTLKVLAAHSLDSGWDDLAIHRELMQWAREYRANPIGLRSLAVVFDGPHSLTESSFERLMWQRIQSFADKDAWLGQPYDHRVSADPDDPHFSLSFGGEGFFVVGLHPNASRPGRHFARPVLAFNLHDQFETLRGDGLYDRMQDAIRARDAAIAGSLNPMLSRHGETSAARQYSGRAVDEAWRCPFSDKRVL